MLQGYNDFRSDVVRQDRPNGAQEADKLKEDCGAEVLVQLPQGLLATYEGQVVAMHNALHTRERVEVDTGIGLPPPEAQPLELPGQKRLPELRGISGAVKASE